MVYISRLKIRNFKSFKAADIQLPGSFVCFAGPNGSGKSNICDSIRFAMGETSLRSLRAKKVKELIFGGAKSAEVTLWFEGNNGDGGYEIKRIIREDGKIQYRLNGKKTTRSTILETLKRFNLDQSGRNIIAQGEVATIINMNSKERRGIIDSVAGIADFEDKKKEAIRELDLVDDRIKEARLVLGERKVYLDELGREKETAIGYLGAKKKLANAKGTLLKTEIDRLEKDLESALNAENEMNKVREEWEKELSKISEEIAEIEKKRAETSAELQSKQKTNQMIRRLEELKASVGSKSQLMADKEVQIQKIRQETESITGEVREGGDAVSAIEEEVKALASQLEKEEAVLKAEGGEIEDSSITNLRTELAGAEERLASSRERLITLKSEIDSKKDILSAKRDELGQGAGTDSSEKQEDQSNDVRKLENEVIRISKEIENSFSRTKEINAQMGELDKEMLELKEKASIYKLRSSPGLANPALALISQLKQKEQGIYGTVADLISFEPKYSHAVEAAGGSRLLYVVVETVDIATEVIEKLKKARSGRASFIPLDKIRAPKGIEKDGFSSVLEVVDFPERIRPAVHYLFADTLLVDSVSDAKNAGIGSARMVTLDGEIFERSGIVSGGRSQSGILSANQLRKIENELAEVKDRKESLMQELYSIREDESRMRSDKSGLEIRLKTIEMKANLEAEKRKENEQFYKRKEQLARDIADIEKMIADRAGERDMLESEISEHAALLQGLRERLRQAEEEARKLSRESSEKRAELSGRVSSLRATIDGKKNEIRLRRTEAEDKKARLSKLEKDGAEYRDIIKRTVKEIKDEQAELASLDEKISSTSRVIEKLFEKMKSYDEELQQIGAKRGKARSELDRINKDMNQVEIKKATTTTRLEDIRAEFSGLEEFEFIEGKRDTLTKMVAEAERTISSLGNVNLAAIEAFDRKKQELDGVEEKISKLGDERKAILSMIEEIEEHKKDAFFETFHAVNDNFKNLFKLVNVGQGHLYLNNPSDPFESGLLIKLRRNEHEHSLDALSGGEKTVVAMMFIFALQMYKPSPFYILDEVDAALDKPNSKNLSDLVSKMSNNSQFIMVSHNDIVMSNSDTVVGVTKGQDNVSKLVGIKIKQVAA